MQVLLWIYGSSILFAAQNCNIFSNFCSILLHWLFQRQIQLHHTAAALGITDIEAAAVTRHDLFHNGQTDTAAARLLLLDETFKRFSLKGKLKGNLFFENVQKP